MPRRKKKKKTRLDIDRERWGKIPRLKVEGCVQLFGIRIKEELRVAMGMLKARTRNTQHDIINDALKCYPPVAKMLKELK